MEYRVFDANSIRNKIKQRKQKIQKSLQKLNKRRVVERRRIKEEFELKSSVRNGKENKLLYNIKAEEVNSVLGSAKMSYLSNIDRI